jgi:hypothetical protein
LDIEEQVERKDEGEISGSDSYFDDYKMANN